MLAVRGTFGVPALLSVTPHATVSACPSPMKAIGLFLVPTSGVGGMSGAVAESVARQVSAILRSDPACHCTLFRAVHELSTPTEREEAKFAFPDLKIVSCYGVQFLDMCWRHGHRRRLARINRAALTSSQGRCLQSAIRKMGRGFILRSWSSGLPRSLSPYTLRFSGSLRVRDV